jgi:sigma-E factor negative regulatory protein RseC
MTKTGRVREISGDLVSIDLDRTGAGGGCGACGPCGCGEPRNGARGIVIALNREKLPLTPGQRVAAKFPPGSVLAQTLTALLPPLLGLIAGYVLGGLWVSPAGSQAPRAAAGGAGFVIFAGIVYFIRKQLPPGRPIVVYYREDTISCLKDRSSEGPFNPAGP